VNWRQLILFVGSAVVTAMALHGALVKAAGSTKESDQSMKLTTDQRRTSYVRRSSPARCAQLLRIGAI
jgi:hypothetical protein